MKKENGASEARVNLIATPLPGNILVVADITMPPVAGTLLPFRIPSKNLIRLLRKIALSHNKQNNK